MPFSLQDLTACAAAAKWLYENGFEYVNSAQVQYRDFGQEVKLLGRNLDLLKQCAEGIEKDAASGPPQMRSMSSTSTVPQLDITILLEVCGDFKRTIQESQTLLKDNVSYGKEKGLITPLTNILWNNSIKSEVVRFRDRIAIHNRKISFVLEPFKLKLIHDTKLSQHQAFQQLQRGNDNNTQRIDAKLSRLFAFLGAPDPNPTTPLQPLIVPVPIERRLERAFAKALPNLTDHRKLSLRDGVNGVTFHFEHFSKSSTPLVVSNGTVEVDKYLNLMKSVYILNKTKASEEYEFKITRCRDLLWSNYMEDLEESCRLQLKKFSDAEPEATRLKPPADNELQWLYQDDFDLSFGDQDKLEEDPGISMSSNDVEMLHLPLVPLSIDSSNYEYELSLVRRSNLELELRYIKTPKTGSGNALNVLTTIHLQKALMIPVWASTPAPFQWALRFRGDANVQTEGQFMFVKSTDLHLFQQAVLGYKVSYDNRSSDVGIRIYDSSGGPRDVRVIGKFQIWQDAVLNPPASPTLDPFFPGSTASLLSPVSSRTPISPIPSPSRFPPVSPTMSHLPASPTLLSPSSASTRQTSRQDSMVSLSSHSHVSTANTSTSHMTSTSFASTYTTPIHTSTSNGEVTSVQFIRPTEPLLVFLIRGDESGNERYALLGIKLDSGTVARTGCNSKQCRIMRRCIHATIEKPGFALNAMRVDASSAAYWNLAALGKYQQNGNKVERPRKMNYVHVTFSTTQERDAFVERVHKLKEIWSAKVKAVEIEKANARRVNVVRRH